MTGTSLDCEEETGGRAFARKNLDLSAISSRKTRRIREILLISVAGETAGKRTAVLSLSARVIPKALH